MGRREATGKPVRDHRSRWCDRRGAAVEVLKRVRCKLQFEHPGDQL